MILQPVRPRVTRVADVGVHAAACSRARAGTQAAACSRAARCQAREYSRARAGTRMPFER